MNLREVEMYAAMRDEERFDSSEDIESVYSATERYIERVLSGKISSTSAYWLVAQLLCCTAVEIESLLQMIHDDKREIAKEIICLIGIEEEKNGGQLYMKLLKHYDPEEAARWEDDGGIVKEEKPISFPRPKTPEEELLALLNDIYGESQELLKTVGALESASDRVMRGFEKLAEEM